MPKKILVAVDGFKDAALATRAAIHISAYTDWNCAPTARQECEKMSDSQTRILLATDGSIGSFHAAERVVHLAGQLGAKLYVLYAVDKGRAFHAGIHYGEDLQDLRKAGEDATEKVAALAAKHGVESEKHIVEGRRPAQTILWAAEEVGADYIVMGTEGMSRLESIMIGNVAQEVLRNAERSVLLVGGQRSPEDLMLSEPVRSDVRPEDQQS